MSREQEQARGAISPWAMAALLLLVGGGMLVRLTGISHVWLTALLTVIIEGAIAGAIIIAAGGYGYPIVRRIAPRSAPLGLCVVSACAVGLWMLSTAVLAVGSAGKGLDKPWLWWPVIAVGVALAAWAARGKLQTLKLPKRCNGRTLIWLIAAAAVGLWLAGATRPPGLLRATEAYDVLEYHLQVPREFHNAQHIGELQHNCYSYYPLGVEMLFTLAMSLRGGAYEGMYLAKLLHGAFGVLAVVSIFVTLKRGDETRGRFAAVLLATVPFLLYLSWLGVVELAEICYLTLALLWLRQWTHDHSVRSAWCIGIMLGGSCAVKYLSVGLVVGPVLAAMIGLSIRRPRCLWHVVPAVLGIGLLFSPWLVRNTIYTGNPVFPLATSIFGRGHWSAEAQQRWVSGHGPNKEPPVPAPPGWEMPPHRSRAEMFYHNFLTSQRFGPVLMLIAGVGICILAVGRGPVDPWDWALIGTGAAQLAVWTAFTHEMPPRFIIPVVVPVALLAGGVLSRLARMQVNPFRHGAVRPARRPWGLCPAVAIFLAAAGINLLITYTIYKDATLGLPGWQGMSGDLISRHIAFGKDAHELPEGARILLVGDAKAFYFPPETIYYTVFDADRLARLLDGGVDRLRQQGITHVWVDWPEIVRLTRTYGYPASLGGELYRRWREGKTPRLEIIEQLKRQGLRFVKHLPAEPATASAPKRRRAAWPMVTIYAVGTPAPETTDGPRSNPPNPRQEQ